MSNQTAYRPLQWALIVLSSVLVCIWAMQHTIALRNSLLGVGAILGLFYGFVFFQASARTYPLKTYLAPAMLGAVLVWVLAHYLWLSQAPIVQYQELTSTWLRCLLAAIMGFATGLAITRCPSSIKWLWLGLFAGFVVLYSQYLPRFWSSGVLFQPDYFNYIFFGKHNVVMVGTLLIAGLLAGIGNVLVGKLSPKHRYATLMISFLVISAVLFAYVFLFDTRNGIGLAVILLVFACVTSFLPALVKQQGLTSKGLLILFMGLLVGLTLYFSYRQTQLNQGWNNSLEDAQIAIQIDRYPNWQNPSLMGYPKTPSGRQVTINTYERVAWATAALRLIYEEPLGNGVLHRSLGRSLEKRYPQIAANPNFAAASHSAWLDLGLSLGVPGLALLIGSILLLFKRSWGASSPFAREGVMLSVALLLLYTVAELIGQHGLESLFFWVALLSGLQFWGLVRADQRPLDG
ncbi:O-antigen ligase family protein [Polynucleobacter brandtiae]|nr:O-antigen ligase family protein [Polynucleobacter brandtiae]